MSRLFILWVVFSIPVAWSQEAPSDAPSLTLLRAAELTLEHNPQLRSASFGREAASAALDQAALKPQWSVSLQVEDFAGSGTLSGFNTSETTLRLSRIFQRTEVRSGRMSVASSLESQLESRLEVERLDLMALLTRRFEAVVNRQAILQLAKESVDVWQRATELVAARERAGAAPAVERLRTEIRLANAGLQVEDAEHGLRVARLSLAATWGDLTPTFGQANGNLCSLPPLVPFEAIVANLDQNLDLQRFASEQRLQEARARLANSRRRPDWTLSAGVRRIEQLDDHALVIGVSVPLGSSARAAPVVRRANALRQQSVFEEQAARLELHATLYELYQELVHTRSRVTLFDADILPRAGTILKEIEAGYRVGRFSHLELVNAQTELLSARAARLTACSDHQLRLIDIERLTGAGSVWLADRPGVSR
ncbi:MAG: TolC family protein [Proteobacteria bacterium]|nr:TolC family protein [Pseudomonadota bacterium]